MALRAVLFDKDGTLIDFHRTWDAAVGEALRASAATDAAREAAANAVGFDLANGQILRDSIFVAESNDVVIAALAPHVEVSTFLAVCADASNATVAAARGCPKLLKTLCAHGVKTAVVTNDWVGIASEQVDQLGWSSLFETVVGSDSGYGAKPSPAMVTGALAELRVAAADAVMVGDSAHDLNAARAAGVTAVLVTNGAEPLDGVGELADVIIESLDELLDAIAPYGYRLG